MNKRLILRLLGLLLLVEALAMLPSLGVALIYGNQRDIFALLQPMVLLTLVALPPTLFSRPKKQDLRAREGFVVVALAWVLMSIFGALPFLFSGLLPSFADALFESVSGFTTTGGTVLTDYSNTLRGVMFWRSFTHWIGGMGVLVLTLALLPRLTGRTAHLVRAESPGPSLSKIVPKMGDSAKILYVIYTLLTLAMFFALWIAGMGPYEAALHALGTAGTGGFGSRVDSVAGFHSLAIEMVITVFMLLFGVNFALYYRVGTGGWREALKSEELRWFAGIYGGSVLILTLMLLPQTGNLWESLRLTTFHTASIMSTTGFTTANIDLWPQGARALTVLLMFFGSCAGSTAGGMKIVRIALLMKSGKREISRAFRPRRVEVIRFEGKRVDEEMLSGVGTFALLYVVLILLGTVALSLENRFGFDTYFTAALTCVSNVGPGLGEVANGFAAFSPGSKYIMCFLMLCGRLELYPVLVLFHPSIWRRN